MGGLFVCATTGSLRAVRVKTLGGVPTGVHDGPGHGGRYEGPFFLLFPRDRYPTREPALAS